MIFKIDQGHLNLFNMIYNYNEKASKIIKIAIRHLDHQRHESITKKII